MSTVDIIIIIIIITSLAPISSKIRAQWRDKTKGLSRLVIENNAWVVNGWMKKLEG